MSSNTIHPSYAATDKQLNDALAHTTELTDEELAEALRILNAHLSNQKTTQAIRNEIEKLAGQALNIQDTFERVSALLASVAHDSKPDMRRDVEKLAETWKDYSQKYTDFLWNSRQVAGKAEAAARDFAGDFVEYIKDPDVSSQEKRSEIKNYLEKVQKDAASSKEVKKSLTELHDGVKQFTKDWRDLVHKYKPNTGHDDFSHDIAILNGTLWTLRLKIERLGRLIGVISASGGVSSILAALCPKAWTDIMANTLQNKGRAPRGLTDATSEVQSLQNEIEKKTAQRDAITSRLTGAQALHAELSTSADVDIADFITKLGAIASVWETIREDLKIISDLLDSTKGDLPKQLFDLRLDTVASLYNIVGDALRQYQTTVQQDFNRTS